MLTKTKPHYITTTMQNQNIVMAAASATSASKVHQKQTADAAHQAKQGNVLVEPTYILKFLTIGSSDKKMVTKREMSRSTLVAIPFFKQQIEGGCLFKDSLKVSPAINVVDLTIYGVRLEDLIVYFKAKKALMKGKPLTKEAYRALEIKPVDKRKIQASRLSTSTGTENSSSSTSAAAASATSATSATSAASATSTTLTRREKDRQEELLKQEEQEWQNELAKARENPRFNLHGFFKLCDFFIDHELIKLTCRFASEYEDFAVLSDDLLSDIAQQYLDSVFETGTYRKAFTTVYATNQKLRNTFENHLKFLNRVSAGQFTDQEAEASGEIKTVVTDLDQLLKLRFTNTRTQMEELSTQLLAAIDNLIDVIKTQAAAHFRRLGPNARMNLKPRSFSYFMINSIHSIGGEYLHQILEHEFLDSAPFDMNMRLPKAKSPKFRYYCRKDYKISNPWLSSSPAPKVSFFIDQYVRFLVEARAKIENILWVFPLTPFLAPCSYINDEAREEKIFSIMTMVNQISSATLNLLNLLLSASDAFISSNVFDPQMHFTQRVSLFVLQCPAIAKIIWETVELRKMLVYGYMKVPNTKVKRYLNGAFEELIPLTEGRIDSSRTVETDVSKALWSDPELARLYKKYNSWEYRFSLADVQAEHGRDVDIVWKQIQDRTKQIIDKVQTDKQKNAPRGPVKAGWFM